MTHIETLILKVISESNGVKSSEIAEIIGEEKKTVNSILYGSDTLKPLIRMDASTYKWYSTEKKSQESDQSLPLPDSLLHNLCSYYLTCLSLEAGNSVSQLLKDKYENRYVVLSSLSIFLKNDASVVNSLIRIQKDNNIKAFLGYPVRIYDVYGRDGSSYKKIAPVFLFPVEYSDGIINVGKVPSVNMEIIKGYAGHGADDPVMSLIKLETELGMNSPDFSAEPEELVLRLKSIRTWDWAEEIDPYNIPIASDLSLFENGIYNRPIIIETEKEKYTHGLESELIALSNMPEEQYRGTALYSWLRGGTVSVTRSDELKPVLEVLPLNTEQSQAVETALQSDLTVITGPPGTGKSQVVTDLLVNIAWNGKSAIFSSKNNKAVDIVDLRVNGLSKRPVLLRLGSNQVATRLAEIIEGLLTSGSTSEGRAEVSLLMQEYQKTVSLYSELKKKKEKIIDARNRLDAIDKKYSLIRNCSVGRFDNPDESDIGKIKMCADTMKKAYYRSIKKNNGFFARLFWWNIKEKRILELCKAADGYRQFAIKYKLPLPVDEYTEDQINLLCSQAEAADTVLSLTVEYKRALSVLDNLEQLEDIDKALMQNKSSAANISFRLWDKWLSSQTVAFDSYKKRKLLDFVAAVKLTKGIDPQNNPELSRSMYDVSKQLTHYLQCWAVTSLSVKGKVPFQAGLFDYVIIDEASQCDIASIVPLLYRAKRAIVIGDPKQLKHISQISRGQDLSLIKRNSVPLGWSYSVNSLYDLAAALTDPQNIIQLKDHFRSCSEIIEFSNNVFYGGSLRTATDYSRLKIPSGEKPGIRWINTLGKTIRPKTGSAYNMEEAYSVYVELKRLVDSGYKGSIGVTTPFRLQAEKISDLLQRNDPKLLTVLVSDHDFIADTVHKFQGDERDLMIFSAVVSDGAPQSTLGFLSSTGNLFNVAITRARAVLTVVGNLRYCFDCPVDYLREFAHYYERLSRGTLPIPDSHYERAGRDYPQVDNPEQVSDWEKYFYSVLYDEGIHTVPQFRADKYRLDLALILKDGRKLDIEIDGEMYHREWNGELCYRDQLRNQRLFELGWDVKRFWVYQIRDETSECVRKIKEYVGGV